MNSKKHSWIIATICIIALAAISIFVFPFILAASPGNMEIEVIEPEEVFPGVEPDPVLGDETEAGSDPSHAPEDENEPQTYPDPTPGPDIDDIDTNAISMERAIELAWELFTFPDADESTPAGERRGYRTIFIEARYIEKDDPSSDPSWFLLFAYGFWSTSFSYVPEGSTLEETLERNAIADIFDYANFSTATDNFGVPVVIWESAGNHYEMVELNAITGEWIGSGMNKPVYHRSPDEFTTWDNIKQGMDFWWTISRTESGEILRQPLHHEEGPYGG